MSTNPEPERRSRPADAHLGPLNVPSVDDGDDELAAELLTGRPGPAPPQGKPTGGGLKIPALAKLAGALLIAGVVYFAFVADKGQPVDETAHPNWRQHVAELNLAYEDTGKSLVKQVRADGTASYGTDLQLAANDNDAATSGSVQAALAAGDDQAAVEALQQAQQIPEPDAQLAASEDEPLVRKPTISQGLKEAVLSGDARFYHLYLYDSCDEDGDVVDVVINGEIFARVPITHAGATLSIPVANSVPTSVEIVGFRDGEGGITVACQSSQGEFFMRALAVGEIQPLAVVK